MCITANARRLDPPIFATKEKEARKEEEFSPKSKKKKNLYLEAKKKKIRVPQ